MELKIEESKNHPSLDVTPPDTTFYEESVLVMSAVEYKEGTDWTSTGNDQECKLRFGTLDSIYLRREIQQNTMHEILDGELYECISNESKVIVRKDCDTLFVFPNEGPVTSIIKHGGDIYTLAEPDNSGFRIRKNGEPYSEDSVMTPIGGLYSDDEDICLSVCHKNDTGTTDIAIVVNGVLEHKENVGRYTTLIDLTRIHGSSISLRQKGYTGLLYFNRGYYVIGSTSDTVTPLGFIRHKDRVVFGYNSSAGTTDEYRIGEYFPAKYVLYKTFAMDRSDRNTLEVLLTDTHRYILQKGRITDGYCIIDLGPQNVTDYYYIPEGYRVVEGCHMFEHDGKLAVSLVDSNNHAAIWYDHEIIDLGFNGYVDQLSSGNVMKSEPITDRH